MLTLDTNSVNRIIFKPLFLAQLSNKQMKRIACKELNFYKSRFYQLKQKV